MTYWWSSRPAEDVFMEITNRPHIGRDLNAPIEGRGGTLPPAYALVPEVHAGDLVVHYSSRRRQIEGASVVLGSAEPSTVFWGARGVSARKANVKPDWRPGFRVPLGGFRTLAEPIERSELVARGTDILAVRQALREQVGGSAPLYYPWIPYGDGPVQMFQSYLVKLTRWNPLGTCCTGQTSRTGTSANRRLTSAATNGRSTPLIRVNGPLSGTVRRSGRPCIRRRSG